MRLRNKKSGFTLLEIIVVIIIVGILASLALPRLFSLVEFSKSAEALEALSAIRLSVERAYMARSGTYVGISTTNIDIDDAGAAPGARFGYTISGTSAVGYTITATRKTIDGGNTSSTITFQQTPTGVTRTGTGAFRSIQ